MVLSDEQMIFQKKWRSQRVATSTEGLSTLRQYRICQLQDDFLRIGSQILTKQPQNGDFPPCSSRKKNAPKRPTAEHLPHISEVCEVIRADQIDILVELAGPVGWTHRTNGELVGAAWGR